MDTCIGMAESLCSSPETITTLLIGYMPIQSKKFKYIHTHTHTHTHTYIYTHTHTYIYASFKDTGRVGIGYNTGMKGRKEC